MTRRLLPLLLATLLAACAQVRTTNSGMVGVDRTQYMAYPADKFNREMSASYNQMMQGAAQKYQLNQNPAMTTRVREIARRLIPQTAARKVSGCVG
jgi:hypothetical protein